MEFSFFICYNKFMINYNPFFETLKKNNMSQYKLVNTYLISPNILFRMKKNKAISLLTIEIFCKILNCDIEDIVKIT